MSNVNGNGKGIRLREKREILETLPNVVNDSDKRTTKNAYKCSGSILKNKFKTKDNPASYVGWGRTDDDKIVRIEAEERNQADGSVTLALKIVTIPESMTLDLDLDQPKIPNYMSKESKGFLGQQ